MHSTLLLLCLCEDGGTITEYTKKGFFPPVLIFLNDRGENNTDILPIQQCRFGAVSFSKNVATCIFDLENK